MDERAKAICQGEADIKIFIAIILSILYYIGVCVACIFAASGLSNWDIFTYGYPALVVFYFVFMSKVFHEKLKLKRWTLWLWMNIVGFIFCTIALTVIYPHLWTSLMILFILARSTGVLIVLWGIVGIGCLLIKH